MKKLLIDANPIVPYYVFGKVNGIGRTTLELIQALAQIDNLPFEVILYSQNMKGIGGRNIGLPFKNCHVYLPHREKIDRLLAKFPMRECLTGYDLMKACRVEVTIYMKENNLKGRYILTGMAKV